MNPWRHNSFTRIRRAGWALPFLAGMLVMPGCRLFRSNEPLRFSVQSTALDALEILYIPDPASGEPPARMTLLGSGHVNLRRGLSPRVMDAFSAEVDHPDWHHYREDSLSVSLEEMKAVFQRFVDLGLFLPSAQAIPQPETPFPVVRITGRMNRHRVHRRVTEPVLIQLIESIMTTTTHHE